MESNGPGGFYGMRLVEGVQLYQLRNSAQYQGIKRLYQRKYKDYFDSIEFRDAKGLIFSVKRGLPGAKEGTDGVKAFESLHREIARLAKGLAPLSAFSESGANIPPLFFPSGYIYILFDERLKKAEVKEILAGYPGKILKSYAKTSIIKYKLDPGKENAADEVARALQHRQDVVAASPDFHVYADKTRLNQQGFQSSWQQTYSEQAILRRSFVFRAWEFGDGNGGVNAAVIDKNFSDHLNLVYDLTHGYDAADGGHDPRQPKSPERFDQNNNPVYPSWEHGTGMCGVMAGRGPFTLPHLSRGCAPNAELVPIRTGFLTSASDAAQQAYQDSWVANWIQAMIQIFYSRVPVTNFSGTAVYWNNSQMNSSFQSWLRWLCQPSNGLGVFFTASSGNNPPAGTPVAYPSNLSYTFSVGSGDLDSDSPLGKVGSRLDITVPDGYWGEYQPGGGGTAFMSPGTGGTSVASAVAAGIGLLVAGQGFYRQSPYSSVEIAEIIRRTARRSPQYEASADESGQSDQFGYGWIDAYGAVKSAHKGRVAAGRAVPIHFLNNVAASVLVPQRGNIETFGPKPWFWCLNVKSDDEGLYWGHWQSAHAYAIDITAGGQPPGNALVVADYNGDGLDEIAVQLAGGQQHRFFIVAYHAAQGRWRRMGQNQDLNLPALDWGPASAGIDDVISADIDGDNKAELIANRGGRIDIAKYDGGGNQWQAMGPSLFSLDLGDDRLVNPRPYRILGRSVRDAKFKRLHRNDLARDLIVAIATVQYDIGFRIFGTSIVVRRELLSMCSLQSFDANQWQVQPVDLWGTSHLRVIAPNTVTMADIDGDGVEEVTILGLGPQRKIQIVDYADPFPASSSQHGYLSFTFDWEWSGRPTQLFAGDFDGDGRFELAYLDGDDQTDYVRFLKWDPLLRHLAAWRILRRKKLGNPVTAMVTGDFDGDGSSEIGLLLEKPYANSYHIYKFMGGRFSWIGEL